MIRNQWYAVLEGNEIKPGRVIGTTRMGEKLVFWRDASGQIVCLRDMCPHRGVALSAGKLIHNHIQCPFHGFEFDASGACVLVPANGATTRPPKALQADGYPAREVHGFIWIWWGELRSAYPPIRFFESIDSSFSYSTIRDHWATHYSRAIENQLDVVHLPFVHHNTIGRGQYTIVDGPIFAWECEDEKTNRLELWFANRREDGSPARSSREVPKPQPRPLIQFQFPNVWQNWLSDDLRIAIAFAPIDEENTMMYIRQYQRIVRAPVLRQVFNFFGQLGNLYIERQDKRVVETQQPKRSALKLGEHLVAGDRPIIEYRRRREALIRQAQEQPLA